jgi:hypothetical protein
MTNEKRPNDRTPFTAGKPVTSLPPTADNLAIQAAFWLPPHRGRTRWLVVAAICIHCLQGHRHVVERVTTKRLTKTCPVTGASYELDIPRAVRRAAR